MFNLVCMPETTEDAHTINAPDDNRNKDGKSDARPRKAIKIKSALSSYFHFSELRLCHFP